MAGTRHDRQFHHGLLLCLPLLTLLSLSLPLGPARASDEKQTPPVTREKTLNYLNRTLQAIADVMSFYQSQHNKVNLDGVIGMRMAQGTLKVLLQNLEVKNQTRLLPGHLVVDMWSVHNSTKRVADMTEPYVAKNQKKYYHRLWPTVSDGQWEMNYPTRTLNASLRTWEYDDLEHMRENQSDDCIVELFGTGKNTTEPCVITDGCWINMTQMGYHRYSLTHEIFYLQLGELSGCMYDMLVKMENSIESQPDLLFLQETFCLNILKEANFLANQSYPLNSQDLFMEQAGLCGLYGFWEFFRYSWLDNILSWQDKEAGCYKNKNWPEYTKRQERLNGHCALPAGRRSPNRDDRLHDRLLSGPLENPMNSQWWKWTPSPPRTGRSACTCYYPPWTYEPLPSNSPSFSIRLGTFASGDA